MQRFEFVFIRHTTTQAFAFNSVFCQTPLFRSQLPCLSVDKILLRSRARLLSEILLSLLFMAEQFANEIVSLTVHRRCSCETGLFPARKNP